ncbi:MAG: lipopolysaccharide heptosyltransferase I [Helicobacteraceae bacterium]|nr:lipopolysaccharide heptosyltransferase I [Helicobacteraceae bacterium]
MKKIAIVRLSALGDIINTSVVLQFIKKKYPHIKIDWITEEIFAPLLKDHPHINEVHTISLKTIKKEKSLTLLKTTIKKLRSLGKYDLVIDMQGLLKSAIVARLVGSNVYGYDRNSARESIASLFYRNSSFIEYKESIIKRNCTLVADALAFKISEEEIINKEATFSIEPQECKDICFVIGASWKSKIYPKESYSKLSTLLSEPVCVVWGSEQEREVAMYIARNSVNAYVSKELNLTQLKNVIGSSKLVIGNDTGPTHLAWALNVPSITLFGPTNERMMFETKLNIAINSPSTVDINKINKKDFSIIEITPEEIYEKAKALL